MTEQEFVDKVNKAIKECPWKVDMCGVDVCRGDVLPCQECIDSGRCDTIKTVYKEIKNGNVNTRDSAELSRSEE